VAGAKDDRRDAYVLADALRTDQPKFRRVQLDHPLVLQIREVSQADDDLRDEFGRLTNRLWEQLYRCASPLLQLSSRADDPWLWDLVERLFSQPHRRLTRTQVDKLLKRHRIRRLDADEVLRVVQEAPVPVAPGAAQAARGHVALLLPRVRLVHEQRKQCEKQLQALLAAYGDEDEQKRDGGASVVSILLSAPGLGTLVAGNLVGKAAQLLVRADHAALRMLTGAAPVTIQSGKKGRGGRRVVMRRACDPDLRNACYRWSRVSIQLDDHARAFYAAQRARGHSHGRALRSLTDRWLRILVAMLESGTLYDPNREQRRVPAAAIST
jgi:transposase